MCGPRKVASLKDKRYFILFIDYFARFCLVFFLKFKPEVAGLFHKYKALVENYAKSRIKVMRSDNGTEYTSNQFKKLCYKVGIEHQLTVIYSPQQNGVNMRKNKIFIEMTRCLMFENKLPKSF